MYKKSTLADSHGLLSQFIDELHLQPVWYISFLQDIFEVIIILPIFSFPFVRFTKLLKRSKTKQIFATLKSRIFKLDGVWSAFIGLLRWRWCLALSVAVCSKKIRCYLQQFWISRVLTQLLSCILLIIISGRLEIIWLHLCLRLLILKC